MLENCRKIVEVINCNLSTIVFSTHLSGAHQLTAASISVAFFVELRNVVGALGAPIHMLEAGGCLTTKNSV
jgi:hypothetical protein